MTQPDLNTEGCVVSGGFRGGAPGARPPTAQHFLNFMQFFKKFGKIICWRPPRGLAPPPTENPGSAPGSGGVSSNHEDQQVPLN